MTTKQQILLREIIFNKLPGIMDDYVMQECILKLLELYPTAVDVENLIEHSLARRGNYKFINESHRDFDDENDSDSKTVSVNPKTGKAEILGLENKTGSIRITVFNPISPESTSYLYIPKHYLPIMARECYGQNAGKKRFVITWSKKRPKKYKDSKIGYFNQYEQFRVDSFDELASMTDRKFYSLHPHLASNIVSQDLDSLADPKSDPRMQMSSPYSLTNVQQQILDSVEIESIYLSD